MTTFALLLTRFAQSLQTLAQHHAQAEAVLVKDAAQGHFLWTAAGREGLVFCFWLGPH